VKIEISVIIPTHNRRGLLERKLKALEGEMVPFEVIVVADGCTDDTLEFLETYRPPYRLRHLTAPDTFAAFARNRGAEVAAGRVLLFTDDDVISRPGWLEANLRAHDGLSDGASVVAVSKIILPPHLSQGETFTGVKAFWWNANGRSTSVSRALFERVGGYDESYNSYGGEDPDLGYRLWQAGARFIYLPQAVAEHWDEDYTRALTRKAWAAAKAHVKVWRKYGDDRVAWALGIHPLLLRVKRLALNDVGARLITHPRYCYEHAYLRSALEEIRVNESRAISNEQ
jgi:GT2 family glycosyltransferase